MTRWILAAALLAGCGDNLKPKATDDAGLPDAMAPDAATPALGPCIDRPTDLPRPPAGQLPCELLPPGFGAPR